MARKSHRVIGIFTKREEFFSMSKKSTTPPQSTLMLRILGGGYLVYLAWQLREAISQGPLFLAAVVLFGVVGAAVAGITIWELLRHEYFRKPTKKSTDDTEDCEAQSDDE